MQTLMKCHIMHHFISDFTVCQSIPLGVSGLKWDISNVHVLLNLHYNRESDIVMYISYFRSEAKFAQTVVSDRTLRL